MFLDMDIAIFYDIPTAPGYDRYARLIFNSVDSFKQTGCESPTSVFPRTLKFQLERNVLSFK